MGLVSFKAGGGVLNTGYKPSSVTNLTVKRSQKTAALTWTDPEDFTIDDTPCTWARTVLIRKSGSAPQSIHDGTEIAVITERNKHTETPWVDGVLELDVTYYYAVYVVSADGLISDLSNIVSITIPTTRTMTVVIDLNDSNPETCGSYRDDASSMPSGKTEDAITDWQEFFGYKPCLFKDGKVVGYLNPNDYTKFENGDPADITSGDAGDVMIEFPRRGIKISKSGKVITVKMTDDPNDPSFTYYAHSRGDEDREYFYLGAYLGFLKSKKIKSLSGKTINATESPTYDELGDSRKYAHNNGSGYEQLTWYQVIYIQVMYLLQFKGNLNSQKCIGIGYNSSNYARKSGTLNSKGLFYGTDSETQYIKIFGMEDFWGSGERMIDGIITGVYGQDGLLISTTDFNNDGEGYTLYGDFDPTLDSPSDEVGGFTSDIIGTSECGFYPAVIYGSETTYFCDYAYAYHNQYGCLGSRDDYSGYWGLFAFSFNGFDEFPLYSRLSYY